jgi:hypothetical protein
MSETDTKNGEAGGSDAASLLLKTSVNGQLYVAGVGLPIVGGSITKPDLIVKAEFVEMLPDGMVRIRSEAF